jgi:hypothetical protein
MFQLDTNAQFMYDGSPPFAQNHFEDKTDKLGTHKAGTPILDDKGRQIHGYSVICIAPGSRSQEIKVKIPLDTTKPLPTVAPGFVKLKGFTIKPYSSGRAVALSFTADAVEASPQG